MFRFNSEVEVYLDLAVDAVDPEEEDRPERGWFNSPVGALKKRGYTNPIPTHHEGDQYPKIITIFPYFF